MHNVATYSITFFIILQFCMKIGDSKMNILRAKEKNKIYVMQEIQLIWFRLLKSIWQIHNFILEDFRVELSFMGMGCHVKMELDCWSLKSEFPSTAKYLILDPSWRPDSGRIHRRHIYSTSYTAMQEKLEPET